MATTVAGAILKLLAMVGIGVLLRTGGFVKREHASVLNAVIIYAALPALVFNVARRTDLSWDLLKVAGIAWVVGLIGFGIAWALARALRLPPATAAAFMLVTALGNTGYIGYPVTTMLLGANALPQAVFYDVFGTVALLFTIGVLIASRNGEREAHVSVVRELLTAPAMMALLAGFASRLIPMSQGVKAAVTDWFGIVGSMTVPLVMISLGLALTTEGFRGRLPAVGLASAVKLLILPVAAGLAASFFASGDVLRLVMLQAGMPSMMLSLVIGERFGLDVDFIAHAILATTMACVVTIPLAQLFLA